MGTPNWAGAFSLSTTYSQYDLVSYQAPGQTALSTWISNVAGNAGNIPGQTNQWSLFASGGQNGINAWRGVWASGTVYSAFDAVSYNDASYISLVNVNGGNIPSSSPSQWAVLALAGGAGPAGEFAFVGIWSSVATYALNDIVSFNGSSYAATGTPTTGVDPAADVTNWALIASVGAQGPTGPQGQQGVQGTGFDFRGAWSAQASYVINDVVALLGSSYVAVAANTGVNPSTDDGTNWQLMARAGVQASPQFLTGGVVNTQQGRLNVIGTGTVVAASDSNGNLTLEGTGVSGPLPVTFVPVTSGSPPTPVEFLTGYDASTGLFSAAPGSGGGTVVTADASTVPDYAMAVAVVILDTATLLSFDGTSAQAVIAISAPLPGRMIVVSASSVVQEYIAGDTPYNNEFSIQGGYGFPPGTDYYGGTELDTRQTFDTVAAGWYAYTTEPVSVVNGQGLYVYGSSVSVGNGSVKLIIPYMVVPL